MTFRVLTKHDGHALAYETSGPDDGDPLLFIEGLGGHAVGWRPEFLEGFHREGFRTICFDNRDVGLSGRYPGQPYTLADMADDTNELIGRLGLDRVHVVGQSMGGMIAQELAIRHPACVASLALFYTAPSELFIRPGKRQAADMKQVPEPSTRDEAVEALLVEAQDCASTAFAFDEQWARGLAGLMWDRGWSPADAVGQREALSRSGDRTSALPGVTAATLLIHGDVDQLILAAGSEAIAREIPGAQLWLVEGMGHEIPRPLWHEFTQRISTNARAANRATEMA